MIDTICIRSGINGLISEKRARCFSSKNFYTVLINVNICKSCCNINNAQVTLNWQKKKKIRNLKDLKDPWPRRSEIYENRRLCSPKESSNHPPVLLASSRFMYRSDMLFELSVRNNSSTPTIRSLARKISNWRFWTSPARRPAGEERRSSQNSRNSRPTNCTYVRPRMRRIRIRRSISNF